jgi:hypothetical protein
MTGPNDFGPSGIFDHLDDPGAPAPSQDVLSAVVHRGRRIRARRQGTIAMSGAAAVTAAVFGGLGISHAVNAGPNDSVLPPANSATPSFSATAGAPDRHSPGVSVVVPHGQPASSPASPTLPPSPQPCGTAVPTSSPSPLDNGPIVESSVPPLVPSATPEPCLSETPSPTPSPTETASPEPTTTGKPSTSPSPEPSPSQ